MANLVTLSDVPISQGFGVNPAAYARFGVPGHNGVDLAVPIGTQLYAPVDGWIAELFMDPLGYGMYLKMLTDEGESWLLAHLSSWQASKEGDRVVEGTPICLSGNTGNTTGPHTHVGMRWLDWYRDTPYGGRIDPAPFIVPPQRTAAA